MCKGWGDAVTGERDGDGFLYLFLLLAHEKPNR
jgi:hypothetical protein